MALVLDNTVGGPSANTYCLVAEADDYHSTRGFNSEWSAAVVGDKNIVLAWATRLLDQQEWLGIATYRSTGILRWPRYGIVNRENIVVDPNTIPKFLKEACAEWAWYLLKENRTDDEGGLVQYGGKVGPIMDPDYFVRKVMPTSVKEILAPYLANIGGSMGRVLRG